MFAILAEALPVRHSSVHNLGCLNCNTVFREVKLLTIILKDYNLETSTAGPAVKSKEDMSSKCTMCTLHMPLFNPDLCAGSKKSAIWHSWVTLWKVLCLFVLQTGSDYFAQLQVTEWSLVLTSRSLLEPTQLKANALATIQQEKHHWKGLPSHATDCYLEQIMDAVNWQWLGSSKV